MTIKGKEAALAVIIAGLGVGVAIMADNIISERKYIKAKAQLLLPETPTVTVAPVVENADSEGEEDYDDDDESIEDEEVPAAVSPAVVAKIEEPSDEDESIDDLVKEAEQFFANEGKPCDSCPAHKKSNKKMKRKVKEQAELEKKLRKLETDALQLIPEEPIVPEIDENTEDLLPDETYAQWYVRQKRIEEDQAIAKAYDTSYKGNFNEASKKMYLAKRAYIDARKKHAENGKKE